MNRYYIPPGKRDFSGKQILISAVVHENTYDPVRFIGNPSTGKMGIALVQAAVHRGAKVTLVHAPMETKMLASLQQLRTIAAGSAAQMQQAMLECFPDADLIIMAAAVADVHQAHYTAEKLPKRELPAALPLEPVPDIVAQLSTLKQPHQRLIGFAAQTGDILDAGAAEITDKKIRCDCC